MPLVEGLKNPDSRDDLHRQQAQREPYAPVEERLEQAVGAALFQQQVAQFAVVLCRALLQVGMQQARQVRQDLGVAGGLVAQFLQREPQSQERLLMALLIEQRRTNRLLAGIGWAAVVAALVAALIYWVPALQLA